MPNNNPVFVFDGKLCKFEGMTKEQIINAIVQATGVTPTDVDEGFISTLVEQNKSKSVHFWFGSQAEYDALESYDSNTFYIIDGDATIDDLEAAVQNCDSEIDELRDQCDSLDDRIDDVRGDIREINRNISSIQDDVSDIQGDVQALQDSFTFESAYAGFSVLTRFYGSTIENNNLPSRGLYVLYIYQEGYTSRSTSLIMYYDGTSNGCSPLFKYEYNYSGSLQSIIARIKIYANGTATMDHVDPASSSATYTILYRKIG